MRWLVLAVLALPLASAGVAFEDEYTDKAGDNPAPSADILRFSSRVVGERIVQRVEMAAPPDERGDTILVRSWFHNSTNGSFATIDIEVHGQTYAGERFRVQKRFGDYYDVSEVAATYGVDGNAWVFEFDAAVVADATCFDAGVWAQHYDGSGAPDVDQAYGTERRCAVRGDPALPVPRSINVGVPQPSAPPGPEAPGSATTPGLPIAGVLLAAAGATMLILRAGRLRRS